MALKLNFILPEKLYLKDPQGSDYGHRLLSGSIELIDKLGFEKFTFKKLANLMESSEVSIYRYFENKHLLLLYLNCWYWEWVGYLIDRQTDNIPDHKLRLQKAIHCIIHAKAESKLTDYINERLLFSIIMKESSKSYHVANVDTENKNGFFIPYKELVEKVAAIIKANNPKYPYATTLASTLFDMVNNQTYYAEHLPRLTSLKKKNTDEELEKMLNHFAFTTITS